MRYLVVLIIFSVISLIGGCASSSQDLTVSSVPSQKLISTNKIVYIEVKGGVKGDPHSIDGDTLKQALVNSLKNAKMFNDVSKTQADSDYTLIVNVSSQKVTLEGLDANADISLLYIFSDSKTQKILFRETYSSSAKELAANHLLDIIPKSLGTMAIERAVKANILQFMDGLSAFLSTQNP